MSDSAKISIPVKRYETLGLILPGFVTLGAAYILLLALASSGVWVGQSGGFRETVTAIEGVLTQKPKNLAPLLLLLIAALFIAIFVGHMVEAISRWVYETASFDRIYGYPYQGLFDLHLINRAHLIVADGKNNESMRLVLADFVSQIEALSSAWFAKSGQRFTTLSKAQKKEVITQSRELLTNLLYHKAGLMLGILSTMLLPPACACAIVAFQGALLEWNALGFAPSPIYLLIGIAFAPLLLVLVGLSVAWVFFAYFVRKARHERRISWLKKSKLLQVSVYELARRQEQAAMFAFRLAGIDPHISPRSREQILHAYRHFFTNRLQRDLAKEEQLFGELELNFYRSSEPYWFAYWYLQRNSPAIADKINRSVNHTAFSRNLAGAWLLVVPMLCGAAAMHGSTGLLCAMAILYPIVAFMFWARFIYFYVFTTKTVFRCLYVEYLSEARQRNAHRGHESEPGAEFGV